MILIDNNADVKLAGEVSRFYADPLGWAHFAFPWGVKGTPLEWHSGPCPCQVKILRTYGEEIRKRAFDGHTPVRPIRIAVASGHGVGKSAAVGMLDNFIRSTRPNSKGTVTANTFQQLSTKTWAAITSWNKMSITGHWFELTGDRAYRIGRKSEWFSSAQTCGEENSEAFAGQHAADSTSYYINDECSAIPDQIFVVEEGGLTDGEPAQFMFGNPTQTLGKFARIMAGHEKGWITIRIDSRDCPLTNKEQIQEWVDEYGEDSDFVRVRVRGLAPRAAAAQYMAADLVAGAAKRRPPALPDDPLVAGVDFAWGGEDKNCIRFRQGLDAYSIAPMYIPGERTRTPELMISVLAEVLSKRYNDGKKVAMMFVDSAGIAGIVVRRLRELGHTNIIEVNYGGHAADPKYKNARAYMYGKAKDWMPYGGIDNNVALQEDLTAPEVLKHLPLLLEPKDAIIKRIGRSTDDADAFVNTFFMDVPSQQKVNAVAARRALRPKITAWS